MNGNDHKGSGSDLHQGSGASSDQNNDENRQPLKLTFSISLSSLKRKKEQQEQEQQESGADADNDSINDTENTANVTNGNNDENHDQDSSEDDTEGEAENGMGSDHQSKGYKQDVEMENAGVDPNSMEKPMNGYNNDSFSNTESDSNMNMNMKEDEENNSMADMSQEGILSQDDYDEDKPEPRTRRTRSASIDDRDPTDKSSSQDEIGSIGAGNSGIDSRKKDDASQDSIEKSSRSAATAERELLGFREPATTTAPTTSFLDSLSEEQRRVRTRHLPDVAGFRRLHKSEIKRDMALVRKMLKAAKSAGGNKKNFAMDDGTSNNADAEKMDVNGIGASEDESQSENENGSVAKTRAGRGHISDLDVASILENPELPNIFSLPFTESPYICTDIEGKMTASNAQPSLFSSPQVVESITAFNPPRPPESVGPKKMHRLNRWERNPQDVEVDLSNYRKTVERTRQELHKAEDERERIEVVGQHLRVHYMTQLQCMRHEMDLLNESYEATQGQCIKAADLLTCKTRNRGVARGSNAMKDVLSVLKSRGESYNTDSGSAKSTSTKSSCSLGVGGISENAAPLLASGWILPGDKVSTAYGEGVVANVFGPCILDASLPAPTKQTSKGKEPPQSQEPMESSGKSNGISVIIPPRVCVKLGFGQGYFCPANLKSLESTLLMSDDQLGKRWMSMIESAQMVKTCIDFAAVENYDANHHTVPPPSNGDEDVVMDTSEANEGMDSIDSSGESYAGKGKLLPYGSSLLPSSSCRGGGLESISVDQVEKSISDMLDKSAGVLGVVSGKYFLG